MQQKRESLRLTHSHIRGQISMNRPSVLSVSSVIVVVFFSVITLFSCQQDKIRNSTESSSGLTEKTGHKSNSNAEDDWLIRPIPGKIIAFHHIPTPIPVQIFSPNGSPPPSRIERSSQQYKTKALITTSEGRTLQGTVRHLVTAEGGWSSANGNQTVGFPWAESRLDMYEKPDNHPLSAKERYQPFLVLDSDQLVAGLVRIGDKTIGVEVEDLPELTITGFNHDDELNMMNRFALPDPVSPLDAYRRSLFLGWSLVASLHDGLNEKEVNGFDQSLPEILSRQNAANFFLRLNRLRSVSPSVADSLVEVLTRRCRDGTTTFASWVAHPADLANLEYVLSSRVAAGKKSDWASSVLAWVDDQPTVIAWVESSHGKIVRFALANLNSVSEEREVVFVSRLGAGLTKLLNIPAQTVYRTQLTPVVADPTELSGGVIEIRNRGRVEQRLSLRPSEIRAVPPFVLLSPAIEMWQVDSWVRRDLRTAPLDKQTTAQLSFHDGRWQLRFDCQIPIRPSISVPTNQSEMGEKYTNPPLVNLSETNSAKKHFADNQDQNTTVITELGDLSGVEAITLFVGAYHQPNCVISIMPDGGIFIWEADREANESQLRHDLELTVTQHEQAWSVALNLPDWWLDGNKSTIEIGYLRTHDGWSGGESYPYPCLPWRLNPGRVHVDLSLWNP